MKLGKIVSILAVLCLLLGATAFVFPQADAEQKNSLSIEPLPLPGQAARDFQLTAVVGGEIKKIKLSDYRGKWVYLTFIPAAFTFV